MLIAFKKIRKNLLANGKVGKYLLYAVGEIILVVIGILIAVQINNKKENEQNKKQETKLLVQLKSDLVKNKEEVITLNERLNINKGGIDSLIVKLRSNENTSHIPFYINFVQRQSFFYNASSGYNMTQNGMSTYIENKEVLGEILNLYENDFISIRQRQDLMHSAIEDITDNYVNQLFEPSKGEMQFKIVNSDKVANDLFTPIDFNSLSKNISFLNSLIQLKNTVERRLASLADTEIKIDQVISLIDQELDR